MKIISRKFHAVLDYLSGAVLIAAPWLLGFSDVEPARWVAVFVGAMILLMSMMTDYEGGLVKALSMKLHLTVDVITGIFLAASPWLFGFSDQVYLPHLLMGILAIGSGLCTENRSLNRQAAR